MTAKRQVQELVKHFSLQAHPEGGFYRESYRAKERIEKEGLPPRFAGPRSISTAIYFLLPEGAKSHLHRIKSDELWHFYLGGALELSIIHPGGDVQKVILGCEIQKGQFVQFTVPAGSWFGAEPFKGSGFSFVGCTVAPGFDFTDFEMGNRGALIRSFPAAKSLIERLTD